MARYLSTVPNNLGLYNLGTVWSYPTGGTGPTAYGPTSYFGSDPLPANAGDSVHTPIDLGDFSAPFKTLNITNTHGGLSRKVSTFFRLRLTKARTVQFTQNFSQFSYHQKTNRNTLIAFYHIGVDKRRIELPINDSGYVYNSTAVDYDSEEYNTELDVAGYPTSRLAPGEYLFLITNDIRFIETTYSITVSVASLDWRYVNEGVEDTLEFGLVTSPVEGETVDFGSLAA
jgi:hypothetical protein